VFHGAHVRKWIEELHCDSPRRRVHAARKLGCRLYANFCAHPEVLDALVDALLCDSCGEVRRAAAGSLQNQNAQTDSGLLALYLAANLDPDPRVQARAAEALDVLARGRGRCGPLLRSAGALVRHLRGVHYQPGSARCRIEIAEACSGVPEAAPSQDRPPVLPGPPPLAGPEVIPSPASPDSP
jgi:hypothetical protein